MAQACDPQSLVNQANCILCGVPQGMYLPILIALMCQIQSNQTSGSGQVLQGTVNPTSAPANPALPALYTNLTSGTIFTWNVTTQAWV